MRRWLIPMCGAMALVGWFAVQARATFGTGFPVDPGDEIVLEGTYRWTQGGSSTEPLLVTLERRGPDTWKGTFEFRFGGRDRTWKGTLIGDPIGGDLRGEVSAGRGRRPRTWLIEGRARNGVVEATHRERLRSGGLQLTGTLTVRPVG